MSDEPRIMGLPPLPWYMRWACTFLPGLCSEDTKIRYVGHSLRKQKAARARSIVDGRDLQPGGPRPTEPPVIGDVVAVHVSPCPHCGREP